MAANDLDQSLVDIEFLAWRYQLPEHAVGQLKALLGVLIGDPHAPTAVREPARAVRDHLADALVALDLGQLRSASTVADVGSGAGLPGLPLAIALPGAEVFLVESSARKCAFLERAIAASALANAHVVHARAESWEWGLGRFDVVTARAVAPLAVVAEYAAPLLRVGGTFVAWRGRRDAASEATAARAASELGLEGGEPMVVQPYSGTEYRHLQLMLKVRSTPSGFPRREGLAAKRPLGSPDQRHRPGSADEPMGDSAGADNEPSDRVRR